MAIFLAFGAGMAVGLGYFFGLWETVRHLSQSRHPALWMTGSLIARMGLALLAFYLIGAGDFSRLLACLAGFMVMRELLKRRYQPISDTPRKS